MKAVNVERSTQKCQTIKRQLQKGCPSKGVQAVINVARGMWHVTWAKDNVDFC